MARPCTSLPLPTPRPRPRRRRSRRPRRRRNRSGTRGRRIRRRQAARQEFEEHIANLPRAEWPRGFIGDGTWFSIQYLHRSNGRAPRGWCCQLCTYLDNEWKSNCCIGCGLPPTWLPQLLSARRWIDVEGDERHRVVRDSDTDKDIATEAVKRFTKTFGRNLGARLERVRTKLCEVLNEKTGEWDCSEELMQERQELFAIVLTAEESRRSVASAAG